MPQHLKIDDTDEIDLTELIAWLRAEKINTSDPNSLTKAAPALRKLGNNKDFLADTALAELKKGYINNDPNQYIYSAQVMLLHLPPNHEDNFFIRANFWPSLQDQQIRAAGTGPFFYHRPHDHNFNFLTIGYHGPGYWSQYYEYDQSQIHGYPGEAVPSLKFIERRRLAENAIMFYQANLDVHDQQPADSLSISLNIAENTPRARQSPQYAFDLEKQQIKQLINISLAPCLFGITAIMGGDNGQDVLNEIINHSPDPLLRFSAHKALAGMFSDPEHYCQTMAHALSDKSPLVSLWASQHIAQIRSAAVSK